MPAPAFKWKTYEVRIAEQSPLRALGITTPSAATPGVESVAEAELIVTMLLPLPDLSAWPNSLDKAKILLESAAEVEHALMVQYLYSAYSLKKPNELSEPNQRTAVRRWRNDLLDIAREEMGHLMSVQNILLLLSFPPNFEREDFPPRKDIYPFKLHLEPLSQKSLAKYVVAESPVDAPTIDDIKEMAEMETGMTINHVGILYGLLGLIFTKPEQVAVGGAGSETWDEMVRKIKDAAYQQHNDAAAWHLPDEAFHPGTEAQQANPDDWQVGDLRVHRVNGRDPVRRAICDIGEQGEGPTSAEAKSHFERFLAVYRGIGTIAFPAPGQWVPTRNIPIDPKTSEITDLRTKRWAELVDIRYALLLGFLEHYLVTSGDDRNTLTGWVFSEMRSRIGHMADKLTEMPRGEPGAVAAVPFTLPNDIHLPAADIERWATHKKRTEAAISKVEEMQAAGGEDQTDPNLTNLLASDRARLVLIESRIAGQSLKLGFARDIRPLFRPIDIEHMSARGMDLSDYLTVRDNAQDILDRIDGTVPPIMPLPPAPPWTKGQIDLFKKWMEEFPE